MKFFKSKKILITGHTGFKGSWLSVWLKKLGGKLYGVSFNIPSKPSMYEHINSSTFEEEFVINIEDQNRITKVINSIKPDIIFHLAAQPLVSISFEDPVKTFQTNAFGTINILEAIKKLNSNVIVIFITSDKVYYNEEWPWGYKETDRLGGKDPYSASKAMAENAIFSYYNSFFSSSNVRIGIGRAGNVIGGGDWAKDRIIPDCIRSWSNKKPVNIRNPDSTRPWQHVLEPIGGYILLCKLLSENKNLSGEPFNFGPGSSQDRSVIELIKEAKNLFFYTKYDLQEKNNTSFKEAKLLKLNCDKSLMKLNWLPVLNFKETVSFTMNWYAEFYKSNKINTEMLHQYTNNQIDEYLKIANSKGIIWPFQI